MEPVQTCYLCKTEKRLDHFIQRRDSRYYNMCRACFSEVLLRKSKGKKRLHHTETERTCYLCRRFLSADQFTRRSTGTYFSACKDCNKNVFAHRRRARMAESEGSFSTEERETLLEKYDSCPGCGRRCEEIPTSKGRKSSVTGRRWIRPCLK